MKEYELYVPRNYNSGAPVEKKKLKQIKRQLAEQFGGVSEIHLRKRGWWKMGDVIFRDKITIFRVYAVNARSARRFFRNIKNCLSANWSKKRFWLSKRTRTSISGYLLPAFCHT